VRTKASEYRLPPPRVLPLCNAECLLEKFEIAEQVAERRKPLEQRLQESIEHKERYRDIEPPLEVQLAIIDSLPQQIREAINDSPARYIFTPRARDHVFAYIKKFGSDYVRQTIPPRRLSALSYQNLRG
jgi:hypothetical protein